LTLGWNAGFIPCTVGWGVQAGKSRGLFSNGEKLPKCLASKTARVLAKVGQNLGGSDIDNWVDYFATTQGLVATLTTRLAERLKIQLSSQEQSEVYFNDETFESYELQLDRYALEILKEHQFLGD